MNLYKINDVISSEFIRFPMTLLANPKYRRMSLEAKVVYALLLNRLTLSQRNGWLNEQGEVYLIYTREETANTLNITYKKAISAFKELLAVGLIIEKRRGRGFPNIIFLVKAELNIPDSQEFDESFNVPKNEDFTEENQELPKSQVKTCQNGTSKPAKTAVLDIPNRQSSNINNKKIENSQIYVSQSIADETELTKIYSRCELDIWDVDTENMFKNAIDRLYFSESCRIGQAVIPQTKIRSYLKLLTADVLVSVEDMLRRNTAVIRNPTGYLMSAIINTIFEQRSNMLAHSGDFVKYGGDG
jgi:hypothetical protein